MSKKTIKMVGLAGTLALAGTMLVGVLTFAASEESILNDKGIWKGGVGEKTVYSLIEDTKSDGYKIKAKVVASNEWGKEDKKNMWTTCVGKPGRVHAAVDKGMPNPFGVANAYYDKPEAKYESYN